jgi:uncharacterized protein
MKFDVKAIVRTSGSAMEIQVMAAPRELGLVFTDFSFETGTPVVLEGTLQNAGHGMLVLAGEVTADYEVPCARCLTPIRKTLRVPIRESFRPVRKDAGDARQAQEDIGGDDESYAYDGFLVDASDAVREILLAEIPIRELCKENCAGLCPVCGVDRNQVKCACQMDPDAGGSPFGKLDKIL